MSDSRATFPGGRLELAVLLSGGGRTLENLAQCIERSELDAKLRIVVSSKAQAYGLKRAAKFGVPATVVERKAVKGPSEFSAEIWNHVRGSGANFVVLAGFMSLLTIPDDFAGRVLNIHPALLPSFGGPGMFGHHVHEAVLAAGCKVTGCTVHLADQTYDTGPIILQRCCPVLESDTPETLADRVFEEECIAYPAALRLLAAGRIRLDGRRAIIRQG